MGSPGASTRTVCNQIFQRYAALAEAPMGVSIAQRGRRHTRASVLASLRSKPPHAGWGHRCCCCYAALYACVQNFLHLDDQPGPAALRSLCL
jgi:hypothetical protein